MVVEGVDRREGGEGGGIPEATGDLRWVYDGGGERKEGRGQGGKGNFPV